MREFHHRARRERRNKKPIVGEIVRLRHVQGQPARRKKHKQINDQELDKSKLDC
jgi:hypothetical protein